MKNLLKVLIVVAVCCCLFSFNCTSGRKDFFIIFGAGFRNDTVSLELNDNRIMEKIILRSDTVTDISRAASIHLENGNLVLLDEGMKIVKSMPFKYDEKLKVIIKINERPYDKSRSKKGKYIVISKHWYYYNIYLKQYKKPVSFE